MESKKTSLKTLRLVLKPFETQDMDAAIELFCNEEIKKTFMLPDFSKKEDAEALFTTLKEFSLSQDHFVFGIYHSGQLIGFFNDVDIKENLMEVGYVIHPKYQNQGYATEALSAVIKELFRMGYSVVTAGFFSENQASRRVMEKCGMKQIERTECIEYRGKIHHCIYYSISR